MKAIRFAPLIRGRVNAEQQQKQGESLTKPDKAGEPVTYTIKGIFKDVKGHFPMSEKEIEKADLLDLYRENSFVKL